MKDQLHKTLDVENKDIALDQAHPADIAEQLSQIKDPERILTLVKGLAPSKLGPVLVELEDNLRLHLLDLLPTSLLVSALECVDIDDAVDLLSELPEAMQPKVISQISDPEKASHILELIRYPEDSAGGLMSKEFVQVKERWIVLRCFKEMRRQAESVKRIDAIFVVDENDKLKGILSLKKILLASTQATIAPLYNREVHYVSTDDGAEEVVNCMKKYDLLSLPVVDGIGRLVGVVTMDDALDFAVDEAEKDYQLASGISNDVESKDSLWALTKARFPWLAIGLIGGTFSSKVVATYGLDESENIKLVAFMPLIAAMAGNVGVQSAAIIVQGLSSPSVHIHWGRLLFKELSLALVNGAACAALLFLIMMVIGNESLLSLSVSLSLVVVITFAALFGTFIPLSLDRFKINPALATGPFITTLNDIFGLVIYFWVSKMLLSLPWLS